MTGAGLTFSIETPQLGWSLIAKEEESRELGRELGGWESWRDGSLGKPKLVGFTRLKIRELVPTRSIIKPQSVLVSRSNGDTARRDGHANGQVHAHPRSRWGESTTVQRTAGREAGIATP